MIHPNARTIFEKFENCSDPLILIFIATGSGLGSEQAAPEGPESPAPELREADMSRPKPSGRSNGSQGRAKAPGGGGSARSGWSTTPRAAEKGHTATGRMDRISHRGRNEDGGGQRPNPPRRQHKLIRPSISIRKARPCTTTALRRLAYKQALGRIEAEDPYLLQRSLDLEEGIQALGGLLRRQARGA